MQTVKFRNVFANHIKFQVHRISFLDLVEVGVFVGVGNDGHAELVFFRIHNSQARTVDGDGSFLMHLGSIKTTGTFGNKNLKYILLNNNSHDSVGGQSTYANDINFKKLSHSLGFKNFYSIQNDRNLKKNIQKFF